MSLMAKFKHSDGTIVEYPDHFVGSRVVAHLQHVQMEPVFQGPVLEQETDLSGLEDFYDDYEESN